MWRFYVMAQSGEVGLQEGREGGQCFKRGEVGWGGVRGEHGWLGAWRKPCPSPTDIICSRGLEERVYIQTRNGISQWRRLTRSTVTVSTASRSWLEYQPLAHRALKRRVRLQCRCTHTGEKIYKDKLGGNRKICSSAGACCVVRMRIEL